jgi:hypothetical protein
MGMIPAMRQRRSSLPEMFDPSLGEIGMPRTPVPADFLHLFMDKEVSWLMASSLIIDSITLRGKCIVALEWSPLSPQAALDYNQERSVCLRVILAGDLFQRFLALQNNPEALFTATARMPDTPFGNLSQYMGG